MTWWQRLVAWLKAPDPFDVDERMLDEVPDAGQSANSRSASQPKD